MLGARIAAPPGRMERKSEEHESPHAGEWLLRLCSGRHPSAERLAAGHHWQLRRETGGFGRRGPHRGGGSGGRIGPAGPPLHVRKLVAQRRHIAPGGRISRPDTLAPPSPTVIVTGSLETSMELLQRAH